MKRVLVSAMVLGLLTVSSLTAQHGQFNAGVGPLVSAVGGSFGWHIMGAGEWTIPRAPLGLRADVMYGRVDRIYRDNISVGDNQPWHGGTASVVYHIGRRVEPRRFYMLAGVGYMRPPNDPGVAPTFVAGTGLSIGGGAAKFVLEGRFMSFTSRGDVLFLVPVTAALSFGRP